MARKTGKNAKVEVEVGTVFYAMAALSTVASPAADVRKKFTTSATYLSDGEKLQPVVRLDGVISGFVITPGTAVNSIDYSAGTLYIQGTLVTVVAGTITGLIRPTVNGQVHITVLTVDIDGNVNKDLGSAGVAGGARGAAGGAPFLPIDEVLIGYLNMIYYDGSASGGVAEIDSETKERAILPSPQILYHDGGGSNPTNVGAIVFASQLPLIHAATAAGAGTDRRNVYASYYDVTFEELPESMDFSFTDDIAVIKSKAYGDIYEESSLSTATWSMTGTTYWDRVKDLIDLIKSTKRWVKLFPDADETEFWVGRGVFKANRNVPLDGNLDAAVTIEGSGQLFSKAS
jgi:hypothetical protein